MVSAAKILVVEKPYIEAEVAYSQYTTCEPNGTGSTLYSGGSSAGYGYTLDLNEAACQISPHFPTGGEIDDVQVLWARWEAVLIERTTQNEYWLDNTFSYLADGRSGWIGIVGTPGVFQASFTESDWPKFGGVDPSVETVYYTVTLYQPHGEAAATAICVPEQYFEWAWMAAAFDGSSTLPSGTQAQDTDQTVAWTGVFIN